MVAVEQLGHDGLGGKQHRAAYGNGESGDQGRTWDRRNGSVDCDFTHREIVSANPRFPAEGGCERRDGDEWSNRR